MRITFARKPIMSVFCVLSGPNSCLVLIGLWCITWHTFPLFFLLASSFSKSVLRAFPRESSFFLSVGLRIHLFSCYTRALVYLWGCLARRLHTSHCTYIGRGFCIYAASDGSSYLHYLVKGILPPNHRILVFLGNIGAEYPPSSVEFHIALSSPAMPFLWF